MAKTLKKLILTLLILALAASPAIAAGTIIWTENISDRGVSGKAETRILTCTVTWDASAGAPANTAIDDIPNAAGTKIGDTSMPFGGWYLFSIEYLYGATAPTDDTDLYLWATEDKTDVLGGQGVDRIDNAADTVIYPANSSQMLTGDELVDFDNNLVNSATCTIKIRAYR